MLSLAEPADLAMQHSMGADLTVHETSRSLRCMAGSRSPGPDGIPAELYQSHRHLWARILTKVFNRARREGALPPDLRLGTQVLLWKKSDRRLLSNYRSIVLLQRSYCVLSTALALRMRRAVVSQCRTSQRGFVPLRSISDNILECFDALEHAKRSDQPCALIGQDLLKGFDMVNRTYCHRCVDHMLSDLMHPGVPAVAAHDGPGGGGAGDITAGYDGGPRLVDGRGFGSWIRTLHYGALRRITINGVASETFALISGLAQGCSCSCCLFLLVEEGKAVLCGLSAADLSRLQAKFPDSPGLQKLRPIKGLLLPDGQQLLDVRYCDDFNAVVQRGDLAAFFEIVYYCGTGSGSTLNESKSFIAWIGPRRDAPPWPEAATRGIQWVPDGQGLTVLGVEVGYGDKLRKQVWDGCISKAITSLRAWGPVRLERPGRVTVFRAYALAVWAYTARVLAPLPEHVSRMEALKRRFVLTGRIDAGITSDSSSKAIQPSGHNCSSDELSRDWPEGGSDLPLITTWLDGMRAEWVCRLADPIEQTQRWAAIPLAWTAEALGAWAVQPGRRGLPHSHVGLGLFLAHHRGRGSVLTQHNGPMPAEWRLRFTAFARATPELTPLPASTVEAAMATPLWHNTLLGTGRGVLEYGRALTATERTPWLRWARAGLVQLGDLYDTNARCYIPLTTLRQTRGLHRHATQEEYCKVQAPTFS